MRVNDLIFARDEKKKDGSIKYWYRACHQCSSKVKGETEKTGFASKQIVIDEPFNLFLYFKSFIIKGCSVWRNSVFILLLKGVMYY